MKQEAKKQISKETINKWNMKPKRKNKQLINETRKNKYQINNE